MKGFTNFYLLLSIILILNKCSAFFYKDLSKGNTVTSVKNNKDDDYYIVIFNNTISPEAGNKNKRSTHSKESNIALTISEIQNFISDNKDKYNDIEKYEEIEAESAELRKRDDSNENDNRFVFELATVKDKTSVYAYLSKDLIKAVESYPNVIACLPRRTIKYFSNGNYFSRRAIKKETGWDQVKVKKNSPIHLSLISQGKFDEELVDKYDRNYYYPKTAGKDIDIFDLDTAFYFGSSEFSNKKDRIAKCVFEVRNGTVNSNVNSDYCYGGGGDIHGQATSIVAAGRNRGVAPKANIYGISLSIVGDNEGFMDEFMVALRYIRDNLMRPNKAVFNLSFGESDDGTNPELTEDLRLLQDLINEMADQGAVFIAAAGNSGAIPNDPENKYVVYPCVFDNVICVGGIDNNYVCETEGEECDAKKWKMHENIMTTQGYKLHGRTNYGPGVDLYAPIYATFNSEFHFDESYYMGQFRPHANMYHLNYTVEENHDGFYVKNFTGTSGGTSISSPIVAGIAANIMSENPKIKFNSKSMLEYLNKTGEKDIIEGIPEGSPNVFVNNGKRLVYSSNNIYHGCGIYAGNKKCAHNKCCSADGHCNSYRKDECKTINGCQVSYGICRITKSKDKNRCGKGFGSCPIGQCCSSDGYCGKSSNHCNVGCQKNYGHCRN